MSELYVTLPNGTTMTFGQAARLGRRIEEFGKGNCHWHVNHCGCCFTIHRNDPPLAVIIDPQGGEHEYPGARCGCGDNVVGQTDVP